MQIVRPPTPLNRIFRFGEFEFSIRSAELLQNGTVVRLQYQPLRVLLVLLENSGDVVAHDEIRDRVWQDSAIQDFDNSLRVAVAKLRQALGDDPDNPQYIETLPRRGYRWLYPITVHDTAHNALPAADRAANGGVGAPIRAESPAVSVLRTKNPRGNILIRSAIFTLILWMAAFVTWKFLRPQPDVPDPKILPLSTYPGLQTAPSLSPDGKRVAFAWTGPKASGPYRVYVKPVAEDHAQPVTETPADAADGDPVWTADGRSVLFFRRDSNGSGIYIAPAQGGPARQLVANSLVGRRIRRARFDISPQGSSIVYPSRMEDRHTIALFLLDLGTMQSRQLTFPPPDTEGDSDPAFSHDGKTIAFHRNALDLEQVYIVPATGGDARVLTQNNRMYIDGLAWSSDDRDIFIGGPLLRRISVSGRQESLATVSYLPGPVNFPSLRGQLLAYSADLVSANIWKLELLDQAHALGVPEKLIASSRQQAAASYSPDGSQIAFQSDRSGAWEIWRCRRDGSDAVQLTHFGGPPTGTPRWSPDGRSIAFDSRVNGVPQIYVTSRDGGQPRQLTHDPAGSMVPAWSRDGKWIYYSFLRSGVTNLLKLPVTGGPEQPVTTNGGIYAAESPDGKFVYFSRSQADPTVWRAPVSGGSEELVPGAPRPFTCSHWALGLHGISIVDQHADLLFYALKDGRVSTVFHHPEFLSDWSVALAPDGREILWVQIDARFADLMRVQNFR